MEEIFGKVDECVLGDDSVFSFLCDEDLSELTGFFQSKTVKAGEPLWVEGAPSDYVAFIVSGRVDIKKKTDFEGKHVVVGVYSKGAVIGALGILDSRPRAVTAVAREEVSLVIITKENFDRLIKVNPELGIKLMKGMLFSVSVRLRKSFERLTRFF
jgi:CRP-like cAMP-binding protein